ncbi:hypothetical protein CP975_04590 [Streptomyces alboniger]|uniref:Peptidase M10 metallopeptidase domain-containing protein n=1 Tax=Streptomyces alboniger TaxID=132473 RepID=A0A5J6HER8_STRAD|nr:hypothetical protein CP975_04590 [Streptomyces alboniger]
MAAVGAAAAVVAGLQLSPSAFGTDDADATDDRAPASSRPATAPTRAEASHAGRQDFGSSGSDGTRFRDGVMSLTPAPPAASARRAAPAAPHGEGWTSAGAARLLGTGYTVRFYDKRAADWLGPYVKRSVADLRRVTNLPVTVDSRPVGWDHVRTRGEVVIGLLRRPCVPPADGGGSGWKVVRDGSGSKNLSCGFYASSLPATVTSGHAYINDEFFTADGKPAPSMGETYLRNHISHELGHTMGLAHANRGAAPGDCVKGTDSGQAPVMCTPGKAAQDDRKDARAVLAAAARKTAAQSSYKTVQTGQGGTDRSEMLYQKKPAASVIKAEVSKSAANPTGVSHMLSMGGSTYVKTDKVPGKSWYSMDLGGGADGGGGAPRAAGYVAEFAGALAATKSTAWVAEEKTGGRAADHYRGKVVLDELAEYTGPALSKDLRDLYVSVAKKQGLESVVIDMWVGKDDLVLKSRETGEGKKGREVINEEYSDFGAVPTISAPPAGSVATWDEFIAAQARP